jgi:hypothetical protein
MCLISDSNKTGITHMSLISIHTHHLQAQLPGEGKVNRMRFMKNLNNQIALTSYLNHS